MQTGLIHNDQLLRNIFCNALGIDLKDRHSQEVDNHPVTAADFEKLFMKGPRIDRVLAAILKQKEEDDARA